MIQGVTLLSFLLVLCLSQTPGSLLSLVLNCYFVLVPGDLAGLLKQ